MRRRTGLVVALPAIALAGCGSSRQVVVTVTAPNPATTPTSTSVPQATTKAATPAPPVHPLVHFTLTTHEQPDVGTWPFTAQLSSITENPNGFSGAAEPPQDTYLMVQLTVTSGITGRLVPVPKLAVTCHAPGEHGWESGPITATGYDQGAETDPDPNGNNTALGDGQAHLWDIEWQVPKDTPTTNVHCTLHSEKPTIDENLPPSVSVQGSGRLN